MFTLLAAVLAITADFTAVAGIACFRHALRCWTGHESLCLWRLKVKMILPPRLMSMSWRLIPFWHSSGASSAKLFHVR
jgi:hypothetical protein